MGTFEKRMVVFLDRRIFFPNAFSEKATSPCGRRATFIPYFLHGSTLSGATRYSESAVHLVAHVTRILVTYAFERCVPVILR